MSYVASQRQEFPAHWRVLPFDEALADVTAGNPKVQSTEYLAMGAVPVIDQGQAAVGGYVNDLSSICKVAGPVVLFGDHTKILKYVDHSFALGADGVKVLSPIEDLDAKFAFYFLRTVRLPNVGYSRHFKYLKEVAVPVPPPDEQQRITAILDRADAIRRKRKQAIALTEQLLRSTFLEMFGDPVTNPKAWPLHTLTTVTANKRHAFAIGPFGSNLLSSDYQEAGCPVVFVRDIVSGKYRHKSQVFISHEKAEELVAHTVDCGDVLVTKMGMPPGTACVYPIDVPRAVITADVIKLTPNLSQVLPWYLASELNAPFCKQQIIRISAGITRLKVTLGDFRTIQIRVPPISLQKKYDEFRIATERLRERAECLCSEADDLFSSLTNRAFKEQAISD